MNSKPKPSNLDKGAPNTPTTQTITEIITVHAGTSVVKGTKISRHPPQTGSLHGTASVSFFYFKTFTVLNIPLLRLKTTPIQLEFDELYEDHLFVVSSEFAR